jgi:hypothetical protein
MLGLEPLHPRANATLVVFARMAGMRQDLPLPMLCNFR